MSEKNQRTRTILFVIFGMHLFFTVGDMMYQEFFVLSDAKLTLQVARTLLSIGLMYLIYVGKYWAKILFSFFLVVGLTMLFIELFSGSLLFVIPIAAYNYTLYYLNVNDDFEEFMRFQRSRANRYS